ncbi:MAG: hypothetical protein K2Y02_05425 [Burkholderiaceae bacterium]|nr:hypothetical protein [Burkholderiaceae bacterium]
MREIRGISWWRALGGRWAAARAPRDPDDMGDMGTAFGLDAYLQADSEFRAFQDSKRVGGDTTADTPDRLNGRSVI